MFEQYQGAVSSDTDHADWTADDCGAPPIASLGRFILFTVAFLTMLPGSLILFFRLGDTRYGIQFASVVGYSAATILYTFSANRGMQRYLFECPYVRSQFGSLAVRHMGFLVALLFIADRDPFHPPTPFAMVDDRKRRSKGHAPLHPRNVHLLRSASTRRDNDQPIASRTRPHCRKFRVTRVTAPAVAFASEIGPDFSPGNTRQRETRASAPGICPQIAGGLSIRCTYWTDEETHGYESSRFFAGLLRM